LDIKYDGLVVEREVHYLFDKRMENFLVRGEGGIMTYSHYHNGKEQRYRLNSFLRRDIRAYLDIDHDYVWMHVLDWCRKKTMETIEM